MAEQKKIRAQKLEETILDQVAGGFIQTIPGASFGEIIRCPQCGNDDQGQFFCDGDILANVGKDLYTCANCGKMFAVAMGFGTTDIIN